LESQESTGQALTDTWGSSRCWWSTGEMSMPATTWATLPSTGRSWLATSRSSLSSSGRAPSSTFRTMLATPLLSWLMTPLPRLSIVLPLPPSLPSFLPSLTCGYFSECLSRKQENEQMWDMIAAEAEQDSKKKKKKEKGRLFLFSSFIFFFFFKVFEKRKKFF